MLNINGYKSHNTEVVFIFRGREDAALFPPWTRLHVREKSTSSASMSTLETNTMQKRRDCYDYKLRLRLRIFAQFNMAALNPFWSHNLLSRFLSESSGKNMCS